MSSMRSGLERGKRTGAVIATQAVTRKDDGFEDEDAMFDAVASPDPSKASTSSKKKSTDVVSKRSSRLVRFSLESKAAEDNEASAAQPTKQVAAQSAARKMITEPRESLSPSDISRASTAPPLPKQPEEDEPEQELVTQPEDSQRDVDDTDFPTQDDDEEGDDLIPPAPPESPEEDDRNENIPQDDDDDDEEDHVARQSRTSGDSHDNIPQPDDDDFDDDDDDDDNKEGDGFEMASDDPETPASVRQQRKAEQDAAKKKKKKKGAARDDESKSKKSKKKKRSKDDSDEGTVPRKKTKKKKFNPYSTTFSPKGNPGPREFTTVPISDMKDVREDDEKGVRRSKRTHIRPLEYWRGERVIYGPNDEFDNDNYDSLVNMPVPKAISRPEPTPYKKPRRPEMKPKVVNDKKKKTQSASTLVSDDMEPFDNSKIRKKYPGMVSDGDEAYLWDEVMEEGTHMKVIGYKDALKARPLPMGAGRKKVEGKVVGLAAQAFNVSNADNSFPGYLMGNLILPPKGIKDAESVGFCAQTFTCVLGQPGAIEVAYSDPDVRDGSLDPETAYRFFVQQGDMFRIPPGNCYRLENHSKEVEAYLTWTIIRPSQTE